MREYDMFVRVQLYTQIRDEICVLFTYPLVCLGFFMLDIYVWAKLCARNDVLMYCVYE
jgi:hypothetical protein